ncbi:MAG TPA: hypothetical protein VK281_05090 [Xanthobacteraceae bacterium]|nr:hypothetical protein [Xanthobacteraceae bacterium]
MSIKHRLAILMCSACVSAALLPAGPAAADDAQTERLQRQIDAMQQQLLDLKRQMKQTKEAVSAAPAGAPDYTKAPITKAPWPAPGVQIKVGGFIEAAGIFSQRNLVADVGSPGFSSIPFPNSSLYHEPVATFSARQSRISLLATGDIDPIQHLAAYFEMDFLGAGVTANSRESNSYQPRIRQAFASYDNDDAHFHVMAGQGWSLLTQNRVGITPRMENIPLTIDAQYVVGFNWARQTEFRLVGDWNKVAWFGVSLEAPQVNFVSNGVFPFSGAAATANFGGGTLPPGITVNDLNACQAGGLLNNTTSCSINEAPDIIEKFAFDPGWGHYEVVGIQRFFTDRVYETAIEGTGSNKTHLGWGAGGSVLLPLWPKYVDFQGSVLTGAGLGRYGSSQLPDVAFNTDGSLNPLQTTQAMIGLVAHPVTGLDVYSYAGQEQVNSAPWTIGATQGGYGNPFFVNNGCLLESQVGGSAAFNMAIAPTVCTANIQRTQEFTVGFWQDLYKGNVGRVVFGMQYEYINVKAFPGTVHPPAADGVGTPNAGLNPNNSVFLTSLRFYPWQ